ncbi:hypothetical protein D3C87_1333790 [compost metagenome]
MQAPQVATGVRVIGYHHVEHFEQVGHGPGKRHDHVHGRRQRPVAAHRDHPARRRVGAQTVVRRRAATARPGFLGQTERCETGRGCRARTVRRTRGERRGEVTGVVRALGTAVDPALHAAVGHGRHVGLAQANGAGTTQPFDGECIAVGNQVFESGTARSGGQALDQVTVLGRVGDAIERTQRLALGPTGIAGLRFLERIRVAHHHCIQGGRGVGAVVGVDPREVGLDQLYRCGLAGFERSAQLGNGNFGDFNHAVTTGSLKNGFHNGTRCTALRDGIRISTLAAYFALRRGRAPPLPIHPDTDNGHIDPLLADHTLGTV